jgi:hypothetical protein
MIEVSNRNKKKFLRLLEGIQVPSLPFCDSQGIKIDVGSVNEKFIFPPSSKRAIQGLHQSRQEIPFVISAVALIGMNAFSHGEVDLDLSAVNE